MHECSPIRVKLSHNTQHSCSDLLAIKEPPGDPNMPVKLKRFGFYRFDNLGKKILFQFQSRKIQIAPLQNIKRLGFLNTTLDLDGFKPNHLTLRPGIAGYSNHAYENSDFNQMTHDT